MLSKFSISRMKINVIANCFLVDKQTRVARFVLFSGCANSAVRRFLCVEIINFYWIVYLRTSHLVLPMIDVSYDTV